MKRRSRPGFTLLEMILALSIGLILLISLYNVLNMQVQQAQGGRLVLQESLVARGIFQRMTKDILSSLGPVITQPAAASSSSGTTSGTTGATGASATSSTGTTGTTGSTTGSTTTDTTGSTTVNSTFVF